MGIINSQLIKLQKLEIGSFAIWDDEGSINNKFLNTKLSKLHGNVILLGLNRSGKKKPNKEIYPKNYKQYEFRNFHSDNHTGDKKLREIIEGKLNKIEGAYMTDLYYDIESKSGKINKDNKKKTEAAELLINQIRILNEKSGKCISIVCFGGKVFRHLRSGLDWNEKPATGKYNLKYVYIKDYHGFELSIYRVWHYGNWGKHKEKIIELKKQLNYINENSI